MPRRSKRRMICLTAATGLLDAIKAAGGEPDAILRAAEMDRGAFANPDGYIPSAAFARVLEECARATKDESFGLHFGETYNPKDAGAVAYVILNSPTVAAAFDNAARYVHLHNEAVKIFRTTEGSRIYLRHALPDLGLESLRQQNEYSMAVALNVLRIMAGSAWVPLEVQFAHEAPRDTSEHTRIFGCPVSFGCETNALALERDFLDRQVPAADPRLYPLLKRYLDEFLKAMPREDDFLSAVRKTIADSMHDGSSRLGGVAKQLAMSPRALQRKLDEYGTDFKALVGETRRRFAIDYLRDPNHTPTEIAFLLGYSEVSAFNHAFKRWTGSTPLEHRRKTRGVKVSK
jgi:AraC-like DNA-binding protein